MARCMRIRELPDREGFEELGHYTALTGKILVFGREG